MSEMDDFIEREEGDSPAGRAPAAHRPNNADETTEDIKERLPQTLRGLVACKGCLLLRTMASFAEHGCDNCNWGEEQRDDGSFFDFVTPNYEGFLALLQPTSSWVAEWQQMGHCVAGAYAMEVYDDMQDHVLRFYTDRGQPYHRRKALPGAKKR